MSGQTPLEAVEQLIRAINDQDVELAVSQYEPGGALVRGSREVAMGVGALRNAFEGIKERGLIVTTKRYKVIEAGDIALYCLEWSGNETAPDGSSVQIGGKSTDVLRRQSNGGWLIALDNPMGTEILG